MVNVTTSCCLYTTRYAGGEELDRLCPKNVGQIRMPPREGAARSKVLPVGGCQVVFQIVPCEIVVDDGVYFRTDRLFHFVRLVIGFGQRDLYLSLVHVITSVLVCPVPSGAIR